MRILSFLLLIVILSSCYRAPAIEGFDKKQWEESIANCDDYRVKKAQTLFIGSSSKILTLSQNELQELLGKPTQHQLFNRNQKFFYYQLDCQTRQRLAVRFDALGRVKEVTIEKISK